MRSISALPLEALAKWGKFFFILILSFVFLFLILQKQAFAEYTITTTKDPKFLTTSTEAKEYLCGDVTSLCPDIITENTQTVHITFTGLVGDSPYGIGLSTNFLLFTDRDEGKFQDFVDKDDLFDDFKFAARKAENGSLTLDLCADGENALKIADSGECGEKDYFWGGHVYSVVIFNKDENLVDTAIFYVSHHYPKVSISPQKPTTETSITVRLEGSRRPHNRYDANRYAVGIGKEGSSKLLNIDCDVDLSNGKIWSDEFPPREEGDYVIIIAQDHHVFGGCFPGFIYYGIKVKVRDDVSKNKGVEIIPDPGGMDIPGAKKGSNAPRPPCSSNQGALDTGTCPEVNTALGKIRTNPAEFIGSIFAIILSLAGGIAVLLIIYSGYRMVASQGNPEKLEEARQQLVSAIVGLLFLIFSLVILQVIGVDILKLDILSGGSFSP